MRKRKMRYLNGLGKLSIIQSERKDTGVAIDFGDEL